MTAHNDKQFNGPPMWAIFITASLFAIGAIFFSSSLLANKISYISLITISLFVVLIQVQKLRVNRFVQKINAENRTLIYKSYLFIIISLSVYLIGNIYFSERLSSRLPLYLNNTYVSATIKILDIQRKEDDFLKRASQKKFNPTYFIAKISSIHDISSTASKTVSEVKEQIERLKQIRLSWYPPTPELNEGDEYTIRIRLKSPIGSMNFGGFDYETWLFQKRIDATGYVVNKFPAKKIESKSTNILDQWNIFFHTQREKLISIMKKSIFSYKNNKTHLLQNLTQDQEIKRQSFALLVALASGDGRFFSKNDWRLFSRSGITHLVIISGFHFGLIFSVLFFGLRGVLRIASYLLAKHYNLDFSFTFSNFILLFIALPFLLAYASLVGWSLPTLRSLLMTTILILWIATNRTTPFLYGFLLSAFVITLWEPTSLISSSFWLSFMAVLAIWLHIHTKRESHPIKKHTGKINIIMLKIQDFLKHFVILQLKITIVLIPFLILFFKQFSLAGIFFNLIAIPTIGFFLTILTIIATILLFIVEPIGNYLLHFAWEAGQVFFLVLNNINWSYVTYLRSTSLFIVALAVIGGLWICCASLPKRYLAIFLYLPLFLYHQDQEIKEGEFEIRIFDVGQANAALLKTKNNVYLIDSSRYENFYQILQGEEISSLSSMFISSSDADHSRGAKMVIKELAVGKVLYNLNDNKINSYEATNQEACIYGKDIIDSGALIQILHPSKKWIEGNYKKNDNSCVIKIQGYYNSALFPADIEKIAEKELVKNNLIQQGNNINLASDILIAPHHGSKTSSSESFLDAVKPSIAVISAGFQNRYGHPHKITLDKYNQHNIKVYRTDQDGEIIIRSKKTGLSVQKVRDLKKKFWTLE